MCQLHHALFWPHQIVMGTPGGLDGPYRKFLWWDHTQYMKNSLKWMKNHFLTKKKNDEIYLLTKQQSDKSHYFFEAFPYECPDS